MSVELLPQVPCYLQILKIILSDRNSGCFIQKNICSLKDGVYEETQRDLTQLCSFFLVLCQGAKPWNWGKTGKNPAEFGMFRNCRLLEQDALGWREATGKQRGSHSPNICSEHLRVLRQCDRMHINHTEDLRIPLLLSLLQSFHPTLDSSKVVAKVENTSGLDARECPRRMFWFWNWGTCAVVSPTQGNPCMLTAWKSQNSRFCVWCWIPLVRQETERCRRESGWSSRVELSTAKMSDSGKVHLLSAWQSNGMILICIWKVSGFEASRYYLVRL